MEATLSHSSTDQGYMVSPCKRGRNPKRGPQTRSYISSQSRTHSSTTPNLYHSESLSKIGYPPLLPLPTSGSGGGGGGGSRGSSLSPAHKKHNKPSKEISPAMKPEPDCQPKGIKNKKVLFAKEDVFVKFIPKQEEKFSGTAFPLAPPPSSLPMPKFSLKPKMSCKVEATTGGGGGGLIDAGATDNLCRLLNLR